MSGFFKAGGINALFSAAAMITWVILVGVHKQDVLGSLTIYEFFTLDLPGQGYYFAWGGGWATLVLGCITAVIFIVATICACMAGKAPDKMGPPMVCLMAFGLIFSCACWCVYSPICTLFPLGFYVKGFCFSLPWIGDCGALIAANVNAFIGILVACGFTAKAKQSKSDGGVTMTNVANAA